MIASPIHPKTGRVRITRGDGSAFEYVPFALKLHPYHPIFQFIDQTGFGYVRIYRKAELGVETAA